MNLPYVVLPVSVLIQVLSECSGDLPFSSNMPSNALGHSHIAVFRAEKNLPALVTIGIEVFQPCH